MSLPPFVASIAIVYVFVWDDGNFFTASISASSVSTAAAATSSVSSLQSQQILHKPIKWGILQYHAQRFLMYTANSHVNNDK